MENNIHGGHRNRLRELAFKNNFKNLEDHQMLEILLSYVIPRKNTNPIAHNLINKFGSFASVLDADREKLIEVDGIGKATADFIASLKHFFYTYNMGKLETGCKINNVHEAAEYSNHLLKSKVNEEFYLICLDGDKYVKACENISVGTVNKANVEIRKIIETAYRNNAPNVIICHNHPSGNSKPSGADDKVTKAVLTTLLLSEICLLDHIIIAKSEFFSYRNSGLIDKYRDEAKPLLNESMIMQPSCRYDDI